MKAISIMEPHVTLIGSGVKSIETRTWSPKCVSGGVRIGIATSVRVDGGPRVVRSEACQQWLNSLEFWHGAEVANVVRDVMVKKGGEFPLGAVVMTAEFVLAEPLRHCDLPRACFESPTITADVWNKHLEEAPIYAWHLRGVKRIVPIPVKGRLGFFHVDDSLVREI